MGKSKKWNFRTSIFPKVYTEKALLYLLSVKKRDYLSLTVDKRSLCKVERQPKKNEGFRTIYKPSYRLKWMLRRLNNKYLSRLNLPSFVHCGPAGRSIATAARGHDLYRYHLSLDISAFFDSISEATLRSVFKDVGINKDISSFLVRASIVDNQLPQGFPTSSLLSALVIACLLQDFYNHMIGETVLLSVYADDILISANEKSTLLKAKTFTESRLNSHGLSLKGEKEYLVHNGQKFTWLGLQVHPWIALPRKRLLSLEKKVYEYKTHGIVPDDFLPKRKKKSEEERRVAYSASLKGQIDFMKSMNRNNLPAKAQRKLTSV